MCREDCSTWLVTEFSDFPSYSIPIDDIREFVTTALVELRDRPYFVALARSILSCIPPAFD